ncbi:hypothetical protein A3762_09875 [Oleiphilus sp. HI0125]|uniref:acetyltransferase n=1 Tax=Oleiphilus sp. HI0125 TaxID=1822266 RepID=UPI0007C3C35F|nr:acetyltransferase [Oleiphilus sp. HI0125]KZZ57472.1 hypothetical protein A3762_09875 [Oleiphilus sp. HI0125]
MSRLVVVGAGGHGKVCADVATLIGNWDEVVFVDQKYPEIKSCGRWPVVASSLESLGDCEFSFFVAIGDNHVRAKVYAECTELGCSPVTLIHPNAVIASDTQIGAGTVVCAGVAINIGVKVGDCCIVNTGSTIDHDCLLGKAVHISPGAHLAGEVTVGDYSWIGTGAATKQVLRIGSDVMIGVGAAVVSDCIEPGIYAGVPAKRLSRRDPF